MLLNSGLRYVTRDFVPCGLWLAVGHFRRAACGLVRHDLGVCRGLARPQSSAPGAAGRRCAPTTAWYRSITRGRTRASNPASMPPRSARFSALGAPLRTTTGDISGSAPTGTSTTPQVCRGTITILISPYVLQCLDAFLRTTPGEMSFLTPRGISAFARNCEFNRILSCGILSCGIAWECLAKSSES